MMTENYARPIEDFEETPPNLVLVRGLGEATVGAMAAMPEPRDPAPEEFVDEANGIVEPDEQTDEKDEEISDDWENDAPTTDIVRVYLTDIGRVPLLKAEQEVLLSKRIEAGLFAGEKLRRFEAGEAELSLQEQTDLEWLKADGVRARDHLLEANLRLVVSLAKRYQGKGLGLLDLIQEGNFGLLRAVDKFDYMKGYKFSTYATWWIRQALQRAIADQGRTIRIPVHMVEQINMLSRIQRDLLVANGREPSFAEIAAATNRRKQAKKGEVKGKELLTAEKVEEILGFGKETVSLETPIGDTGDGVLGDLIQDTDQTPAAEVVSFGFLQDQLDEVLNSLPEKAKRVMQQRFGLIDGRAHTLDEIAAELGLTRERIRQIERKTITELRKSKKARQLKDYLG